MIFDARVPGFPFDNPEVLNGVCSPVLSFMRVDDSSMLLFLDVWDIVSGNFNGADCLLMLFFKGSSKTSWYNEDWSFGVSEYKDE